MITQEFLNEVAHFTDLNIQKVVLNDSVEITEFVIKQVSEGAVTMQYLVHNGAVSTIEKIDLRDEQNLIVSSNAVHVPVTADTLLLQTIEIKEG